MRWAVIGASVRGAAHERSGAPNQDAIAWADGALEIADGHGSARYTRSHVGARLAVRVAVERLSAFVREHGASTELPGPDALDALPAALSEGWEAAVQAHLAAEPLDEDTPLTRYGATLLAAAWTRHWGVWLQLGDGDIVVIGRDGTVERPVPGDPRLLGNETTSLATPGCWRDFRLCARRFETAPALVMVATDGYSNSFRDDPGFLQVGPDLLAVLVEDGVEAVQEALPEWLAETSAMGSGDDITVGLAWPVEEDADGE